MYEGVREGKKEEDVEDIFWAIYRQNTGARNACGQASEPMIKAHVHYELYTVLSVCAEYEGQGGITAPLPPPLQAPTSLRRNECFSEEVRRK